MITVGVDSGHKVEPASPSARPVPLEDRTILDMKTSRFTDREITGILKQGDMGVPVQEICIQHGISRATYYKWKTRFGGADVAIMARLKELEEENERLKRMYAEERLKLDKMKEQFGRK